MEVLAPGWRWGAGRQAHLTAGGARAPPSPVLWIIYQPQLIYSENALGGRGGGGILHN